MVDEFQILDAINQVLPLVDEYLKRMGVELKPVILYDESEPNVVIQGFKLVFPSVEKAREYLRRQGYEV